MRLLLRAALMLAAAWCASGAWATGPSITPPLPPAWWLATLASLGLGATLVQGAVLPYLLGLVLAVSAPSLFLGLHGEPLLRLAFVASVVLPALVLCARTALEEDRRRRIAANGLLLLACGSVINGISAPLLPPYGDEPLYLVNAHSLVTDLDWSLADDGASPKVREYLSEEQTQERWDADGIIRIGLPILIAPGYALWGLDGARWMIILCGAVLGALLIEHAAGRRRPELAFLLFLLSPLVWFQGRIFTEVPAALITFGLMLLLALGQNRWDRRWWAVVALLAALVMVKVRYLPLAVGFALAFAWQGLEGKPRQFGLLLLGALGGFIALFTLDFRLLQGKLLYMRFIDQLNDFWAFIHPDLWVRSLGGLFFDQEFGYFMILPAGMLFLLWLFRSDDSLALGPTMRRQRRGQRLLMALPVALYIGSILFFRGSIWHGGLNPPSRFLIGISPLILLGAARVLSLSSSALRAIVWPLLLWSGLMFGARVAQPTWQASQSWGREYLLHHIGLATDLPLAALAPSFVREMQLFTWLWCGGLLAAGFLLWQGLRRGLPGWWMPTATGGALAAALAILATSPPVQYEFEDFPRIELRADQLQAVLPFPENRYALMRQDHREDQAFQHYEATLAATRPLPWDNPEELEELLQKGTIDIWFPFAGAFRRSHWHTRRLYWRQSAQGLTLLPGADFTLEIPTGERRPEVAVVRLKKSFTAWQPHKPARLLWRSGDDETEVEISSRLWHRQVVPFTGEGVRLRVPEDSPPLDLDWLRMAPEGASLEPPRPPQPLPLDPAHITGEDLHTAGGFAIPWPGGMALRSRGKFGYAFRWSHPAITLTMRWQGHADEPPPEVVPILNGQELQPLLVTHSEWQVSALTAETTPGVQELVLRYEVPGGVANPWGLFAVNTIAFEAPPLPPVLDHPQPAPGQTEQPPEEGDDS